MCSWCVFVHVWKSDFCFKLVSYCNTMEGKLSPQVAVCLQENLYLPVDPWGEGIILFSLINFCLLFLSLARSLFPAQGHSYSCFPGPMSHARFLVVLQRSRCRCLCTFLKSFGSISMPARDEGHQTVRLSLPQLLSFFALICGLGWFAVPQGLTDAPCVSNLVAQPGWFLSHSDETPAPMSLPLVLIHTSPGARLCSHKWLFHLEIRASLSVVFP